MKVEREIWTREYVVRVTAYRIECETADKVETKKPVRKSPWTDEMADMLDDYD